jgi:hypothetical protein
MQEGEMRREDNLKVKGGGWVRPKLFLIKLFVSAGEKKTID